MSARPLISARLQARPAAAREAYSPVAIAWFAATHLVALTCLVAFASWKVYLLTLMLHSVFGVAITLGAHRYFSHKTFVAPPWLENLIAILYTLSFDRCGEGIISWAAGHKFHHAYPDRELDPHSPIRGFWHAYAGHYLKRRQDLYDFNEYKHYRPDLARKPFIVWLDKPSTIIGIQAAWIALIFTLGGLWSDAPGFDGHQALGFVVWCVCGRYVFTQCSHSMVDTVSHGVGPFKRLPDTHNTGTLAKNNLSYWLMTFGNETWHNVHHAFPKAADNGGRWYEWDLDSFLMKTMARLGLVSGLQFVPASARFQAPAGSRYFAHQTAMPPDLVAALEAASVAHGDAYDSYLVNEPNREYLVAADGRAFVSFVTRGRYVNAVGGLIAAEADKDALMRALLAFAKLNRLTLSIFNISEAELPRYRAAGFQVTRFGQDFVIDLKTTDWKGSKYEWVRRQSNFVRRAKVSLTEELKSAHTAASWKALIEELENLESELLATKAQGRPTGTFQGRLDGGALGRRRLFVARSAEGRAEGFIVCNPYDACRRWAVEIFRHRPDAVRGAAPALIHAAALTLQAEGVEALSLSIIPGVGCETPMAGDSALCRNLMVFWSRWLNVVSDLRGVYHFKTRFRPVLESRYVCVQPRVSLGSIHAFLMVWGILKVHPLRTLRVAGRMLARRTDRATLSDPHAAAAATNNLASAPAEASPC